MRYVIKNNKIIQLCKLGNKEIVIGEKLLVGYRGKKREFIVIGFNKSLQQHKRRKEKLYRVNQIQLQSVDGKINKIVNPGFIFKVKNFNILKNLID